MGCTALPRSCSPMPAVDDCFVELLGSARLLAGAAAASDAAERSNNVYRANVAGCQYELPSACAILLLWDLPLRDATCFNQTKSLASQSATVGFDVQANSLSCT